MSGGLTVLMVAEKPSIAEAISKALSGNTYKKTSGVSPSIPIFRFGGTFLKQTSASFVVTSTTGHVYSIDFAGKYNDWNKVDPTELFDAPIVHQESNSKSRVAAHLAHEAKGADCLVLWLDCDREGENICFEVMGICVPHLNRRLPNMCALKDPSVPPNVFRVKFSSLVETDLRKAFRENLILPNVHEAHSVDARQEIDLRLGVAYTRFLTKYFLNRYGDLGTNLVSYGPCQLPTLWFCVKRKEEHDLFQPTEFYTLGMSVRCHDELLNFQWLGGKIYDQAVAKAMQTALERIPTAKITSKSTKEKKLTRPLPLNTVALLKKASIQCGIGPQRAMHVAEQLYLRGLITYPRTESTAFASAFDLKAILDKLPQGNVSPHIATQLSHSFVPPRKGVDAGDHPPITPCGISTGGLDADQAAIYRLVVDSFLAALSGDAVYEATHVEAMLDTHRFVLSSRRLIKPGFLAVERSAGLEDEAVSAVSKVNEGDTMDVCQIKVHTGQDTRPSLLTEAGLLGLMEKYGIGTDASMAQHIQNIMDRKYVSLVGSNRQLCPTPLGQALCTGLERVDSELARPVIRAIIEKECSLVAKGRAGKKEIIDHVVVEFKVKFQHLMRKINTVDSLFELSFTTIAESGTPFSRCGNCNRYMSYIAKAPQRLICKTCATIYPLPMGCTARTWSDQKCPYDNFETVLIQERSGKAYTVCPMCYTNPPMAGSGKMRCVDCDHPTCNKAFPDRLIDDCFDEKCVGILYLQSWQGVVPALSCTKCSIFKRLDVTKVKSITKAVPYQQCTQCGWYLIKATASKTHHFSGGQDTVTGCLGCDDDLIALLEGDETRRSMRGRGRGRRRGRGRSHIDPKMTFDRF